MLFVVLSIALASVHDAVQPASVERPSGPLASVSGRLVAHDRKPLLTGTLVMSPESGRAARNPVGEARIRPDGSFIFREVPPGRYLIRARGETARRGTSLFATFAVAVERRDVDDIEMTLRPGAILTGQVSVEGRHDMRRPTLTTLQVHAPLPDGSTFGEARGGDLDANGTFTIDGVIAGTHVLVIQGLVFPWRIEAARVLGRDAHERPFDVEAGQDVRGIRVVLTDTAAGVSGSVAIPAGVAASDVLVIAFPADSLRRALPLRFVRVGRPTTDGTYRVIDLAPGTYLVAAALHATEQDALDPAVLERLVPAGTPVTLTEARVSTVPVRLAAAAPASSSR